MAAVRNEYLADETRRWGCSGDHHPPAKRAGVFGCRYRDVACGTRKDVIRLHGGRAEVFSGDGGVK